jgi:Protein of unknown function (DUF2934)
MATKRRVSSEPVSTGAASKRAKSPVTRKHRNSAVAERAETATVPSSNPPATESYSPSFDEIAQLAYSYWESRGYHGGSPEEDWLRAEQELRSNLAQAVSN